MTIPVKKSRSLVRAGERRDSTAAFEYVRQQVHQFPVALLCRVLEISRSGFYSWHRRVPSARSSQDQRLCARIEQIHVASHGTYGTVKRHPDLTPLRHEN